MAIRWGVHLRKIVGSSRSGKTVTLVNPGTGETVYTLTPYNSEPTGFYRHLAIEPGTYSLAIDGTVVSDPFYQSIVFRDGSSVSGHYHASGADRDVVESTWTETDFGTYYRYTFSTRRAYTAGSLRVWLNGVQLVPETNPNYGTGHLPRFKELSTTQFYVYRAKEYSFSGKGTKGTDSALMVDFEYAG